MQGIVEIVRTAQGLDDQRSSLFLSLWLIQKEISTSVAAFWPASRQTTRLYLLISDRHSRQLAELVKLDHYDDSMDVIANFTVQSLEQWHWSPNR